MTLQQIKSIATAKNIFIGIAGIQLIIMLAMSFSASISADEYRHYKQAAKVYKYYQTKGENKAALEKTGVDPMQYNGQSFDNVMYVFEKWFKVDNYMEMRHFFNALTGWLIILLAALIMKELIGYRAAVFVLLAMFFTPRFFGHALNNNKDIPFALGFILTIYGNILFLKQLPKPSRKAYLFLTLGIGLSISIRLAGILNIFFVAFSLGLYYITHKPLNALTKPDSLKLLYRIIGSVAAVSVIGYFIGILFWPYMLEGPIKNISEIFAAISSHPVSLNQIFQGEVFKSNALPWYYTILYIAITYPVYVLVGFFILTLTLYRFKNQVNIVQVITVMFPWAFVVFWMSYKNSNVYGAIRHITFIYPLAVISAVLVFYLLIKTAIDSRKKVLTYVTIALLAAMSWHSVWHIIKNTRYSYVYYNEFIGGVNGAYGNYETDYFYHSIREASMWVRDQIEQERKNGNNKQIIVAANHSDPANYYFRKDSTVKVPYTKYYQRGQHDWDYAIFVNSYIKPHQLKYNVYPPANTVHTIDVNNKPICVVLKRKSKEDLQAYNMMMAKNYPMAIAGFQNVLKKDRNYDWALLNLMECYFATNNYKAVIQTGEKCLKVYGNDERVYTLLGLSYLKANEIDYAVMLFNRMLKHFKTSATGYFYKGIAFTAKKDYDSALTSLLKSLEYNPNNAQAYKIVGDIYKQKNNTTMANQYYQTYKQLVKQ